ncbi:MAG: DUF697 domain-containing protein [Atopobiaceae bacterium]|nr:DUF697 domain-containing protein [Atopobiaceae bacterium]
MSITDDLQDKTPDTGAAPDFAQDDTMAQEGVEGVAEDREQMLAHKRAMVRSIIAAFSVASAAVAAAPLPVKDAVMLSPIELAEVNALARVYDIPREGSARKIIDAIMELGVVSMAARGAIGIVDKSVRMRAATKVKSALIAATIVAGVGVGTAYFFEQVFLGDRPVDELGIYRRFKQAGGWQAAGSAAASGLREKIGADTFDGLAVSVTELLSALRIAKA